MLHHVSIGVADVERAAQFYDAVLSKLGFKRVMEVMPYGIAYGLNDAAVLGAVAARPEQPERRQRHAYRVHGEEQGAR